MKGINLQITTRLHGKIKSYADDRGIPVVGAIRMILSEFFRNNRLYMDKNEQLPEGVIDMGEGNGLMIDMSKLREKNGAVHIPPTDLSKEQLIEWIRKHQTTGENQSSGSI